MSRLNIANNIKKIIVKDYSSRGFACIPEFQIGDLAYDLNNYKTNLETKSNYSNTKNAYNMRPDIWIVNKNGKIIIIEVKSCRQDFITDNKYDIYTRFCDLMYFAIDGDYIDKNELSNNIGLIKLDNSKRGFRFIKKAKQNDFNLTLQQRNNLYFRMFRSISNRYNV